MKINEIQDLIKFVAKSGVNEVELETKDIKIIIKAPGSSKRSKSETAEPPVVIQAAAPVPVSVAAAAPPATPPSPATPSEATPAPEATSTDDAKYLTIKSPMVGTFYRSSTPDKPPFVNVGDEVQQGSPICIIEAMKLFNEIESEVSGKIVKVLVDDASPIEYDQPLFLIDPSK